jgi:hypothetical protein
MKKEVSENRLKPEKNLIRKLVEERENGSQNRLRQDKND